MTRRALPALLAGILAVGALSAFAYTRFAGPEPVAETAYDCTTCDARAASKKRLREHLQSMPD